METISQELRGKLEQWIKYLELTLVFQDMDLVKILMEEINAELNEEVLKLSPITLQKSAIKKAKPGTKKDLESKLNGW